MIAATRPRQVGALILGLASIMVSSWMLGYFALATYYFHFTRYTRDTGQSWRGFVLEITGPRPAAFLLGCLGLAAALGVLGLLLVRAGSREAPRTSLGASAARFCLGGVAGSALVGLVLASLLAYRWLA